MPNKKPIRRIYAVVDEKGNIIERFYHKNTAEQNLHRLKISRKENLDIVII